MKGTRPLDNDEIRHSSAWELSPHLGLESGSNFRWQYNI